MIDSLSLDSRARRNLTLAFKHGPKLGEKMWIVQKALCNKKQNTTTLTIGRWGGHGGAAMEQGVDELLVSGSKLSPM